MAELTQAQYPALKAELTNDPRTLGLAAMSDAAAAAKLNEVGASAETLPRSTPIESYLVIDAVMAVPAEFSSLNAAERDRFLAITGAGKVNPENAGVKATFAAMFTQASAPTARANLAALANRPCTRGEKLFGAGIVVGEHDVARARALA